MVEGVLGRRTDAPVPRTLSRYAANEQRLRTVRTRLATSRTHSAHSASTDLHRKSVIHMNMLTLLPTFETLVRDGVSEHWRSERVHPTCSLPMKLVTDPILGALGHRKYARLRVLYIGPCACGWIIRSTESNVSVAAHGSADHRALPGD
jgi:hypothetical protein